MDIQRLLDLRKLTQAISGHYEERLKAHLTTLSPLFSPLPLLGGYARGGPKTAGNQSEKAYRALSARFHSIAKQAPYELDVELDPPLDLFSATPVLTPMAYPYTVQSQGGSHPIDVTVPLRWTLSYPETEPKRMRALLGDEGVKSKESLVHALLQAVAMTVLLEQRPGLVSLFDDLRCPLRIQQLEGLGALPVVTVGAPLGTRLPEDEIILQNTQLSGIPSFEEIIDIEVLRELSDPIRSHLFTTAQSLTPAIYSDIAD